MSRVTKLLVILSNLVALWLLARLVSRGIPRILVPSVVAFLVSWASAILVGDIITTAILALVYFVPALCFAWFNSFVYTHYAIWLAALCGAMLPRSAQSGWAFPRPFNAPLVLWALVLALSWPIILLREVDFLPGLPGLLEPASFANARVTRSPAFIAAWVLSVTSIATTGLLLLDWLFLAHPEGRSNRFESRIAWPLFAGALVAAAVGVYQSVVDISFLNATLFGTLGRAVGTMRDANAFGMVVALWVPVAAALAVGGKGWRWPVSAMWIGCVAFLILAVWGSGSRTALLAAIIGLAFVAVHVRKFMSTRRTLAATAAVILLAATIALVVPHATSGPWKRFMSFAPDATDVREIAYQLWSRDMYGTAALSMIAEHPFVGIGVGGFNYQYRDAMYLSGTYRPPDNAQNWYRQQLAELGIVGSAGWIAWTGMFLWVLIRHHGPPEKRSMVGAVKGALVGLAVASLLGMPTQDTAAAMTFIVLACWCLKLTHTEPAVRARPSKGEWAAILVVLVCFLGGTVYAGWMELRPPLRALRVDFPYAYGFTPDENNPEFQWTGARAVEVLPKEKRWFKLVIGDVAPDAAEKPVPVKVWFNRRLMLDVNRRSSFPITRWIRMPDDQKYVMIEITAGRTWRPADFGMSNGGRERGVAVGKWIFTDDDPPKGSVTFE